MAITITDRGQAHSAGGYGTGTGTTISSGSFTPAANSLVGAIIFGADNGTAGGGAYSLSVADGFGSVSSAWAEKIATTFTTTLGGTYPTRTAIWWTVVGGSPGAGTVSVTGSHPSASDGWLGAIFLEISGQNASQSGALSGSNTKTSGTSLAIALGGTPAASSLVVTGYSDWDIAPGNATVPTGFTATTTSPDAVYVQDLYGAYLNGGGSSSLTWNSAVSGNGMGVAIEILAAVASFDPPALPPAKGGSFNVYRM